MSERRIVRSTQFKRDAKLAMRRHGPGVTAELVRVLEALVGGQPLAARQRDHALQGWSPPARECHIRPDLLLVYRLREGAVELVRFGSHADLF
jgi:mRNA interferase YafQ